VMGTGSSLCGRNYLFLPKVFHIRFDDRFIKTPPLRFLVVKIYNTMRIKRSDWRLGRADTLPYRTLSCPTLPHYQVCNWQ
jgi:hypothetical protein